MIEVGNVNNSTIGEREFSCCAVLVSVAWNKGQLRAIVVGTVPPAQRLECQYVALRIDLHSWWTSVCGIQI